MNNKIIRWLMPPLFAVVVTVAAVSAAASIPIHAQNASIPAAQAAATNTPPKAGPTNTPNRMVPLIAVAKQEGQITLIGFSHNMCGYGTLIEQFKTAYGLKINELNPGASPIDQIEAIKSNLDNKDQQAPDVINVGMALGESVKQSKLLQPYRQDFAGLLGKWDSIPAETKDPDGNWYGDFYGVLSFEVNTDVIKNPPQDWADLLKPDYKRAVALAADPRSAHDAVLAVYAAGLANGATPDNAAQAGLDWFAKLNQAGNLLPVVGTSATLAKGDTPILIRLDYVAIADRDTFKGSPNVTVVIPKSGVVADVHVQAISAYSPHPMAAKLWEEYVFSPNGQLVFLKANCHPTTLASLIKNNRIPADVLAGLAPQDPFTKAVFPTLEQQTAAGALIAKGWDSAVGAALK